MQRFCVWSAVVVACATMAMAADESSAGKALKVEKYQVTGPVVELTDTRIVIHKDDGKWQIARDAGTKVTGELKVGEKVTVEYKMVAVSIEAKAAKKDAEKVEKAAEKASEKAEKSAAKADKK
jgi:RNase P/RNase MRP subunit p29